MLEKKIKTKFDVGDLIYPLYDIQGFGDTPYQIIAISDNIYHVKSLSDFGEIDYFTIPFNDENMFYTKKNNDNMNKKTKFNVGDTIVLKASNENKLLTIKEILNNAYIVNYKTECGTVENYMIPIKQCENDYKLSKWQQAFAEVSKEEEFDYVKSFKEISKEISDLYEKKNTAYGNSFADTYKRLGIISAVTRLSDKYNRLCNLATNSNIDDLGESLEDTLKDLAAYSIMTLIELRK